MALSLNGVLIDNFKSYENEQFIKMSDLNVLMGANSSGKSTALQTLLILKQTIECNSPDIDLLLSGKYVTLGDYDDVVNNADKEYIKIGVSLNVKSEIQNDKNELVWFFKRENDQSGRAILSQLQLHLNDFCIRMIRSDQSLFSIDFNGKESNLFVKISNLQLQELYISYETSLNTIYYNFLTELLNSLIDKKKKKTLTKDSMMAIDGTSEFFYVLIQNVDLKSIANQSKSAKDSEELTKEILNLVQKFSSKQFYPYKEFRMPSLQMASTILTAYISNKEEIQLTIESIVDKYTDALDSYVSNWEGNEIKLYQLRKGDLEFSEDDKNTSDYDRLFECELIYKQFVEEILSKIFYVGPLREKPQGLYNIGFESVPKYVGTTGAYFASVMLHENKPQNYLFPDATEDKTILAEALNEWAFHLNVANEINIIQDNSFGFSVQVENIQKKKSDIMNVGIGTSQILPVLVMGLLSTENEILIFEQPELHLHPYSQSRLADFFVLLAKYNRKLIVETHSEYMLLRIRYHILKGTILKDQIVVNFFQNKQGSHVEEGILTECGNLKYPDDFKDETQDLIDDLMSVAMIKEQNE